MSRFSPVCGVCPTDDAIYFEPLRVPAFTATTNLIGPSGHMNSESNLCVRSKATSSLSAVFSSSGEVNLRLCAQEQSFNSANHIPKNE